MVLYTARWVLYMARWVLYTARWVLYGQVGLIWPCTAPGLVGGPVRPYHADRDYEPADRTDVLGV